MTGLPRVRDARVEKMKGAVFVEACQAFHKNGDLNLSASIAFYALLFMIWVLLASSILLFCAEIAAANERFMKRR